MFCANCGRKLLTEQSRELGYGPVCYRRIYGVSATKIKGRKRGAPSEPFDYEVPGQMRFEDYLRDIGQ